MSDFQSFLNEAFERLSQHDFEMALSRWYGARANAYNQQWDLENAADHYMKADSLMGAHLSYRPLDRIDEGVENCLRLASVMLRRHRHPEAKAYFRKAFELDPRNVEVQDLVGDNVLRHGTQEEILEFFRAVREVNPGSAMANFTLEAFAQYPVFVDKLLRAVRSAPRASSSKRRGIIVMPLWGKRYVDVFLNYALPILLQPGNFPALAKRYDLLFALYTTKDALVALRRNSNFRRLESLAVLHVTTYDDTLMSYTELQVAQYLLLSMPHYVALEVGRRVDADVILAFPDNLVNDRFYKVLADHMHAGASAVACAGFRLDMEDILPAVDRSYRRPKGGLSISSEGIVRLLMDHLADQWFVDSRRFAISPFFLCWRVGEEGLFVRATHFQPYVIRAGHLNKALTPKIDPVDAQFVARHLDGSDGIVCINNTDMCVLDAGVAPNLDPHELTEENQFDEHRFARFLHVYDTPLHRKYLKVPIRLSLGKMSKEWDRVEEESEQMIDRVFALLDRFDESGPVRPRWAVREEERCRAVS